jgi:branched-chain amino acid aminotransferase
MNLCIVRKDGTIETPRLTGTILEGITRYSVLQLLEDDHAKVVERNITLNEVREGVTDGDITEVFACGTAAVVTPVGRLAGAEFDLTVADGDAGKITMDVREQLMDIQYGRAGDRYGWTRRII